MTRRRAGYFHLLTVAAFSGIASPLLSCRDALDLRRGTLAGDHDRGEPDAGSVLPVQNDPQQIGADSSTSSPMSSEAGPGEASAPPPAETRASCAARGAGWDEATGECTPCVAVTSDATEVFVGRITQSVDLGSQGTRACPFPTLTRALAYAAAHPNTLIVNVEAGKYSVESGETFPLYARGIEIRGAGADVTIIEGQGATLGEASLGGGLAGKTFLATIFVGDNQKVTTLTGLTLTTTDPSSSQEATSGIVCDRGRTTLRNVTLEGKREESLLVTTSTVWAPTKRGYGCELILLSSVVHPGYRGIRVQGEVRPDLIDTKVSPRASLRIGDGTDEGAVRIEGPPPPDNHASYGIEVIGRTGTISLQKVSFDWIAHAMDVNASPTTFEIKSSSFRHGTTGLQLGCGTRLNALEDSVFSHNDLGLRIGGNSACDEGGEKVLRARRNRIVENHYGLVFLNFDRPPTTPLDVDFGTPTDPGRNEFRCNSDGGDVSIDNASKRSGLHLSGNTWDHVIDDRPPLVVLPLLIPAPDYDGIDVRLDEPNDTFDFSKASFLSDPCPEGYKPGPANPPPAPTTSPPQSRSPAPPPRDLSPSLAESPPAPTHAGSFQVPAPAAPKGRAR
jgi:hypothetical protein